MSDVPEPRHAVVLSSGGIDSTTCLAMAVDRFGAQNVVALSIRYGQRHVKELEASRAVAEYYGVAHSVLDASAVLKDSDNALMSTSSKSVKVGEYADQMADAQDGIVDTYVPYRNGLMVSMAAAFAMSKFPHDGVALYLGIHADDAAGAAYADCTPEFLAMLAQSVSLGTYGHIVVDAPFVNSSKADIVARGLELGAPYELTWSCYEGGAEPCGVCATCLDRLKAFRENGVADPAEYR